jgi:putative ATP-dependent endonuclease of the OLD family
MKVKSIKISGFRSINQEIELKPSNVCAIIGANNTGKSNILSAVNKVLGRDWVTVNVFDDEDVYNNEFDKDIRIEIEFDKPLLYEQFVGIDPIPIPKLQFNYTRYKIGENKGQRRLEKNCLTSDNKTIQVLAKKPQKGEQRQYKPLTTIPQEIQEKIPVIYIGADRQLKNQLPNA